MDKVLPIRLCRQVTNCSDWIGNPMADAKFAETNIKNNTRRGDWNYLPLSHEIHVIMVRKRTEFVTCARKS